MTTWSMRAWRLYTVMDVAFESLHSADSCLLLVSRASLVLAPSPDRVPARESCRVCA